jgi:hypothetical protein
MKVRCPDTGSEIDADELCPLLFKSHLCGYLGSATSCSKTFNACRKLGNEQNFSGRPAPKAPIARSTPKGNAS